jgi:ribosomal-protein-alanine N-acetyltransferase
MQPWFRRSSAEAVVRPCTAAEVPGLADFIRRSQRAHVHADWWPLEHYLAAGPCLVARAGEQLVAALACPPDPPPGAWLRALAVADGWSPRPVVERLLERAGADLAALGASELGAMHTGGWLTAILRERGFGQVTQVVTWRSRGPLAIGADGNPRVHVRPAVAADLLALEAIEAEAFEPLWRLSRRTLARMLAVSSTFTVAELDGVPLGYQFSAFYSDHGHLVRLTVRPDRQGQGIGTRLVAELFAQARAQGLRGFTLNTQQENAAAQRLYARFGFRITRETTPVWRRGLP